MIKGYEQYREEIIDGKKLDWNNVDFTLKNDRGWSLAHTAAGYMNLPKDFPHWDVKNDDGLPAACIAIEWNTLPDDFDQWDIMYKGMTMAHYYVHSKGMIPNNFDRWDLVDQNNTTVAEAAVRKNIDITRLCNKWNIPSKDGSTIGHLCAKMFEHDPCSNVWAMQDNKGETVAAIACRFNTIPQDRNFKYWKLRDKYHKKTIKDIYLSR